MIVQPNSSSTESWAELALGRGGNGTHFLRITVTGTGMCPLLQNHVVPRADMIMARSQLVVMSTCLLEGVG